MHITISFSILQLQWSILLKQSGKILFQGFYKYLPEYWKSQAIWSVPKSKALLQYSKIS